MVGDQIAIRCTFMRGGTSRGAFLRAQDLPVDPHLRDRVILALYGSPDPRQIDGLGGADALTSKVAVIGRSARADADIDYMFGQVEVARPQIMWKGNCGNMLSGVAAFAVDEGLIPITEPTTRVRIHNTNTNKVIVAEVPVWRGRARVMGDCEIAGVPGRGAPISLDFGDCAGSVAGQLLPTGKPIDTVTLLDGRRVEVSVVDAATPFVFARAIDVGLSGSELPDAINSDQRLLSEVEQIRSAAAQLIGLIRPGDEAAVVSPSIPRLAIVSRPATYITTSGFTVDRGDISLRARQLAMQRAHRTYAVTGAICTAVAANISGTVVHEVCASGRGEPVVLGHPAGTMHLDVDVDQAGDSWRIRRAALVRTARRLMEGHAFVPINVWPPARESQSQQAATRAPSSSLQSPVPSLDSSLTK